MDTESPPGRGGEGLDPSSLRRLLLYGAPETRRALARKLGNSGGDELCAMLAETVRSAGSLRLRASCLEVLGIAASDGDERLATTILSLLNPRWEGP